ncbi:hypothetical protein ACFVU2_15160 [Leifsonia sp. NPDC058194]|uniref:hypothetical protein n=1 Tax=Leifsonia sp. NPDC058194 TaxID=3346374 RepID=UPI0036DF74D7
MQISRDSIGRMISEEIGPTALDGTPPTFLGSIVTGVALAVGESEVTYLGASSQATAEIVRVRVGAFTAGTVTTIEAVFSRLSRNADVTTRVHRRSDLERLEVSGGAPSVGADDTAEWPGRFTVRALYRDGLELVIPMSDANTPHKRNSVWTIFGSLREDLSGR